MVRKLILVLRLVWRLPELVERVDASGESLEVLAEWVSRADKYVTHAKLRGEIEAEAVTPEMLDEEIRQLRLRVSEASSYAPVSRVEIRHRNNEIARLQTEIARLESQKQIML
jgi:hypothetical protein